MSDATTFNKGPSTADCEVLTDIHTQSDLAEVEVVSLVQELIPRYRLRADTDFACSNQDFIQTPRIDGSEFQALTSKQIRALLEYYESSSNRISQMTKTYHDISSVTRLLEERENDLQMAVSLGQTLLENNDSLRNQVALLEQDIEQTTEIVKQLKHDLLLKERLIRLYTDSDLDLIDTETKDHVACQQYEQKIRHLEVENRDLRTETMRLKLESEHFEQEEQAIVDHLAQALTTANNDIEQLQDELVKKTDQNLKQQDEISSLSNDLAEVHRRLNELKKENEELKLLLSISGKTRHEYESKIEDLEKNYANCLSKLLKSQSEIDLLQKTVLQNSPPSPTSDINGNRQTIFLSPVEYANFMSLENSLQSELEELAEDPHQFCPSNKSMRRKCSRRRAPRGFSETDGESSMTDSAFSDTESVSSSSSCRFCQRSPPIPIGESKTEERKLSSRLRLVKRLEGSHMLKRWQQLAEPSLTSCLQSIPGVYTRAEILQDVKEENEEDLTTPENDSDDRRLSFSMEKYSPESPVQSLSNNSRMNLVELSKKFGLTARTLENSKLCPEFEKVFLNSPLPNRLGQNSTVSTINSDPDDSDDEDDDDDEPATPPSSPTQVPKFQTTALLQQVMQRLVNLSLRTFETLTTNQTQLSDDEESDEDHSLRPNQTLTPPSSPTFDEPIAPTPNTAMRVIKTSTFLRISSLNPFANQSIRHTYPHHRSPGEISTVASDFLRSCFPKL